MIGEPRWVLHAVQVAPRIPRSAFASYREWLCGRVSDGDASSLGIRLSNLIRAARVMRAASVGLGARLSECARMLVRGCIWKRTLDAIARRSEQTIANHYPTVNATLVGLREAGGYAFGGQFTRLAELVQIIGAFSPATFIEFGSGGSSAVFASLIPGAPAGVSYEESVVWTERLLAAAPIPIPVRTVASEIVYEDGAPVVRYAIEPSIVPELVYVDGPFNQPTDRMSAADVTAAERDDPKGFMANEDTVGLWSRGVLPRIIVIDNRRSTVARLISVLPDGYELIPASKHMYAYTGRIPNYFLYHSLLVRAGDITARGEPRPAHVMTL